MSGRDINDLKEFGHKFKIVSCSVKKFIILSHLTQHICEHDEIQ